jgi:hypothetical protein
MTPSPKNAIKISGLFFYKWLTKMYHILHFVQNDIWFAGTETGGGQRRCPPPVSIINPIIACHSERIRQLAEKRRIFLFIYSYSGYQ